jgi:V8-like Glu-specific endopeptidase
MLIRNKHRQQLRDSISEKFTQSTFAMFLADEFDLDLYNIVATADFTQMVFNTIKWFDQEDMLHEFIAKVYEAKPRNPTLKALIHELQIPQLNTANRLELERLIKPFNQAFDIVAWRTELEAIEGRVCCIEVDTPQGTVYGTGFLVGPDMLLTNYHVVESMIVEGTGRAYPAISLKFDYKLLADGTPLNTGSYYHVAEDWLVDFSPYSPADTARNTAVESNSDELDYALLRINERLGDTRGWISLHRNSTAWHADMLLCMVQHPLGQPLKMTLDSRGITSVDAARTRLRYQLHTEAGSSGSPCFNSKWELIALHHLGDSNFDQFHHSAYNQGISIAAIVQLLTHRQKQTYLG